MRKHRWLSKAYSANGEEKIEMTSRKSIAAMASARGPSAKWRRKKAA
jgi:hypothetical protein